jgi:phospholipid transport system transporter-binding protein
MTIHVAADAPAMKVSGSMTMDHATALLADGTAALQSGQAMFDLSDVAEIDSSGLAVLFGWQRVAAAQGKSLTIVNPPNNLRSLADVYGVADLLTLT